MYPHRPFFFWKEVFFVHSDTTVQKRPSRASEKIYTFIFQTPPTENRAKKGDFTVSAHFGPVLRGRNGTTNPL